ncbi:hypothetical protein V8E36_006299 [Tilletia maclaganii]
MYKTIQETTFGQLVYLASGRRLFSYPQDQPGYQAPQKYLPGHQVQQTEEEKPQRPAPASRTQSTQTTQTGPFLTPPETPSAETDLSQGPPARQYSDDATLAEEGQAGHKSGKASPRYERSQSQNSWQGEKKEEQYPWEVKWEDNDPDLPLHWSVPKKCFVTFCICALTFGVYAGSSIVTPSIENIMTTFGVGQPVAGLSLTLFVFGYGTGLFSSNNPRPPPFRRTDHVLVCTLHVPSHPRAFGSQSALRNPSDRSQPPYIVTLAIFVALQVPNILTSSAAGFFICRFLAGFFGSPALATGGASIGDMFGPETRPIALGIWGLSAVCGPTLGPLIGGAAFDHFQSYRWTQIWISLAPDVHTKLTSLSCF